MTKSIHNQEEGYTLVEILIALIVGAMLLGSASLIISAHNRLTHRHRDQVVVNSYAEGKMESLRSEGFLSLEAGTYDVTTELPDELNPPRNASLVVSQLTTGVKRLHLTVTYNELGNQRTQSYTTQIGELGVGQN